MNMPKKCDWITCDANAVGNSIYCIPHGRIYGNGTEVKIDNPIARESIKEKVRKKSRKVRYKEFLKTRPLCEAKFSKQCAKVSSVVHHLKGRAPSVVDNEEFWMATCPICNNEIEARHKDAEEKGLKISQHKKQSSK